MLLAQKSNKSFSSFDFSFSLAKDVWFDCKRRNFFRRQNNENRKCRSMRNSWIGELLNGIALEWNAHHIFNVFIFSCDWNWNELEISLRSISSVRSICGICSLLCSMFLIILSMKYHFLPLSALIECPIDRCIFLIVCRHKLKIKPWPNIQLNCVAMMMNSACFSFTFSFTMSIEIHLKNSTVFSSFLFAFCNRDARSERNNDENINWRTDHDSTISYLFRGAHFSHSLILWFQWELSIDLLLVSFGYTSYNPLNFSSSRCFFFRLVSFSTLAIFLQLIRENQQFNWDLSGASHFQL